MPDSERVLRHAVSRMTGRRAPRPLSSAIAGLTDQLAPRTLLGDVQRVWPTVVGAVVAKEATPTTERGGTLTISCRSSVWAQELDLMAPELVGRLNERLGEGRITALRCVASPPRAWTVRES
jgi:predicted nucleic acid-binding Zn ribbon protein